MKLPDYTKITRDLPLGTHPYLSLLPKALESPAIRCIEKPGAPVSKLLETALVRIQSGRGYIWVDEEAPAIVLIEQYYRRGSDQDLYLDLLHELVHLRQLAEGKDIWDESYEYVDRPTEIEGYATAIQEGRRLGMTEADVTRHLSNPWMTEADVRRLRRNIARFIKVSWK